MSLAPVSAERQRVRDAILADETRTITELARQASLDSGARKRISDRAAGLVQAVRDRSDPGLMEEFLGEYGLSSKEGVSLMCLAEALLRVPDAETVDDLIRDKIAPHDWSRHLGGSSMMVNASTWALMLTGSVVDDDDESGVIGTLHSVVRRLGEPVVRLAVARAMREMGAQFVLGRDIAEAVKRGNPMVEQGYTYSYDMLGEAARTERDAQRYLGAYAQAIASLARRAKSASVAENPGISVKLSALHPRYEATQGKRVVDEVAARLASLARDAAEAGMGLNVDAEEADRLDLSLDVIERVLADPRLAGWDGFGVVVQAYGPRAMPVIDWLADLSNRMDRRLMVRLVKGAYWDSEIKHAQVLGLDGFPVFTRKVHTDVSWISCARRLLALRDRIYPQFATHNAHSVAAVLEMAGDSDGYEFQRLHGMGEALHEIAKVRHGTKCRIYAPVGAHRDLLAYLVRRLLENGANSSFVHQIVDENIPPAEIAADPFDVLDESGATPAPGIAEGPNVYKSARANAPGWDITNPAHVATITATRAQFEKHHWVAGDTARAGQPVWNPARPNDQVGVVHWADPEDAAEAVGRAAAAQPAWAETDLASRAGALERAAELYAAHMGEFMALLAREAGKTWADGISEIREAIDFLFYYAAELRRGDLDPLRGVFVCISPWNFPLAIFTGQIAAALAAGNAVVAKPAEQTPLIAARAVSLLHEAGVPSDVLACLPGDGMIGAALTADPRISGVAFTGSTEVARIINRQLAESAPEATLIAETGGLNAMIVDSTALPEQAIGDIVASAFQSAGQRCSALRVLYIQRDVEERFLEMLYGAMDALVIGDPWDISTDVGPLIDAEAHAGVTGHCELMAGAVEHALEAPNDGHFAAPHVLRLRTMADLDREIFGPVLHVIRFDSWQIDEVLEQINASGFGLTFGLHTRVDERVQHVVDRVAAGNLYVNRDQIGAIVGSQPFGGQGLSGTGPKAGGPLYLSAFTRPQTNLVKALSSATLSADALDAAIKELDATEWAARADRNSQLRALLRGQAGAAMSAAAALDPGPVDLPGPTGESNRYRLVPRGNVLCLGPGEALIDQVVQALAAGNAVIAAAPSANASLEKLMGQGLPLAVLEGSPASDELAVLPIEAVSWAGNSEQAADFRRSLAQRSGTIIPLIRGCILPAAYSHERVICIDTTAAGGNAALLAAAGG